jgi:Transposase DDE domain group 1
VGKAEWTGGAANPRFVVTSLKPAQAEARHLYETIYCARGEMENRIKECQLDLFADRTSAATMRANQMRLWFASFGLCPALRAASDRACAPSLWLPPAPGSMSSPSLTPCCNNPSG